MNPSLWSLIVLAGGKGTRLGGPVPKPLVELEGIPLVQPILDHALNLPFKEIVVIVSDRTRPVAERFPSLRYRYIVTEPLGTGYATQVATKNISTPYALIAQADDSYFYTENSLRELMRYHETTVADFTMGTAAKSGDSPYSYAETDAQNNLIAIKTGPLPHNKLVVCGLYAATRSWLEQNLPLVSPLPNGEIGLPFVANLGVSNHATIKTFELPSDEWQGINTPEELLLAKRLAAHRKS